MAFPERLCQWWRLVFPKQRKQQPFFSLRHMGGEQRKLVRFVIVAAPGINTVANHFSAISDVVFTRRESEIRYGGYYALGRGTDTSIELVYALQLSSLPRRLRKAGMIYVAVNCHPDDTRFDTFLDYELISATNYII